MLKEVIELQSKAVKQIILQIPNKDEITFKSPTGSGKTYMMADLMNEVIKNNTDVIFLVSSLSKGNLAKQNYDKFIEYSDKKDFEYINPYLISSETSGEDRLYIPTDFNVYILPRDLYKDKSKLKQGALLDFLHSMTLKSPLGREKKIYLIKDECHIATSNLDGLSINYFEKIFNFSATPKLNRGQSPDVEITEMDAINANLIKNIHYQDEKESLNEALYKFKAIKEDYLNSFNINPCIIIQISNKDKADEELKNIFTLLNTKHSSLKWMLIVDKDKECDTNDVFKSKKIPVEKWKDYAKTNTATIDVIIFKMVITEGWDIPRACMLYQVRDSKSSQLDEQVIGRIRRNPKLLDFEKLSKEQQSLVTKAYVWGFENKEKKTIYEVSLVGEEIRNEIQNEIKLKTTRLKKPIETSTFDINTFLSVRKNKLICTNIFDLHKKYLKSNNEVKEMYEDFVDDIYKWYLFMENIETISIESKNIICDYENNMEITKDEYGNDLEVSFPLISYYSENGNFKSIGNWIWQRTDNEEKFSFDSAAEQEWAEILLNLINEDSPIGEGRIVKSISIATMVEDEERIIKKYIIAKNYLTNSDIKYEYYLNGIHSSYPDFIMKDYANRIHIFESKSLNKSNLLNIDEKEYEEKVRALKDCYLYASKLTDYYFYIPIQKGSDWTIYQMHSGIETKMSKNEFMKFIKK